MALIEKRIQKDGALSFRAHIRKKGIDISRTFSTREDAELFVFYRQRLIDNMSAFEIPIKDRLTLQDICELKQKTITEVRAIAEFDNAHKRIVENMKEHKFLCQLIYEDWVECLEKVSKLEIQVKYNSKIMTIISPISVRRIFATISSAFSHAISLGIPLENYALKLIQNKINPALKKENKIL